jgi:hypothetical protein
MVDNAAVPLSETVPWLCSSLHSPAVRYRDNWPWLRLIWIESHPIACCSIFFLFPVLHHFFKFASRVIFQVAQIAAF